MDALERTTLAQRLFDLHPIRMGIEAEAYRRMKVALEAAKDKNSRLNKNDIRRLFTEGHKLLSWLTPPSEQDSRDETLVSIVGRLLQQRKLTTKMKAEIVRIAPIRSRGRPSELKHLAVIALEARLARPEGTWEQITKCICPCTKQGGHNQYCVKNLEREVKRLKSVLHEMNLLNLIFDNTNDPILKRHLLEMFDKN